MRRLERLQVNLFTNTFIGTYPVLQMLLSAILEVLYLSRKNESLGALFFYFCVLMEPFLKCLVSFVSWRIQNCYTVKFFCKPPNAGHSPIAANDGSVSRQMERFWPNWTSFGMMSTIVIALSLSSREPEGYIFGLTDPACKFWKMVSAHNYR